MTMGTYTAARPYLARSAYWSFLDVVLLIYIIFQAFLFYPVYQQYALEGQRIIQEQQGSLLGLQDLEMVFSLGDALQTEELLALYNDIILTSTLLFIWMWIVFGCFSYAKALRWSSSTQVTVSVRQFFITHAIIGAAAYGALAILLWLYTAAMGLSFAVLGVAGVFVLGFCALVAYSVLRNQLLGRMMGRRFAVWRWLAAWSLQCLVIIMLLFGPRIMVVIGICAIVLAQNIVRPWILPLP